MAPCMAQGRLQGDAAIVVGLIGSCADRFDSFVADDGVVVVLVIVDDGVVVVDVVAAAVVVAVVGVVGIVDDVVVDTVGGAFVGVVVGIESENVKLHTEPPDVVDI
jgi:hypothetical protein